MSYKKFLKDGIELREALLSGKTIQFYDGADWLDIEDECYFNHPSSYYRVKPEPRRVWVTFSDNGNPYMTLNSPPMVDDSFKEFVEVVK